MTVPLLRAGIIALLLAVSSGNAAAHEPFSVLVFSKTAAFRHDSIPHGIAAVQSLGAEHHFAVEATEDAARFTDAELAQYACVVFLCTTGDVLNAEQQGAFERYIGSGKGYVGIHSASDTEYTWPWYAQLVGAHFSSHPAVQPATIRVADRVHPSTTGLPSLWQRTDEWYNFNSNPRGRVHVLATLDERTYTGGSMGFDHPIAWCHRFAGGRAWYTAGGHTQGSYAEPLFRQHILGGILWAAGAAEGDAGATVESSYQTVVLDDHIDNPMELCAAPDGRVFFIEREGRLKVWRPQTQSTVLAGQIPVATPNEDGLLGLALDPGFATNGWLYLYYSPAGATAVQHVSRFTITGDTLVQASEKVLLQIPTQRDYCCHSGGSLAFGPDGNLYIATGDNTSPFETEYTPIDERPGRSPWDAQKSASNRNDLRGKILRIRPEPDGTCTIPFGNLFADTSQGRPEVYIMGCRNPFRISVDRMTGTLYWGEPGPDAYDDSPARGPAGLDEINRAVGPGNFGWPYCIGPNLPYVDYNFASGSSGPVFDCGSPINDSPNNTGAQSLPASQGSLIHYPYDLSSLYPELGSGPRTAMAGPVYHYDPALNSPRKLPQYFDDTLFIYDFSRKWIKEVKFDDSGEILKINPFLPGAALRQPIDLEMGPDGALYVLEWGTGAGHNADARLRRIEYVPSGAFSPIAVALAEPTSGTLPLTVQFTGSGSYDPEPQDVLSYAWDFDSNGAIDSTDPDPTHTYITAGNFAARLTVTDPDGNTGVGTVPISAGNTRPVVTMQVPAEGAFFNWGDQVPFEVIVTDAEDGATPGAIPCARVTTTHLIGHDDHAHPQSQYSGCSGTVGVFVNPGHGEGEALSLILQSEYTDDGAPSVAALTGVAMRTLRPKLVQAEACSAVSGVQSITTADSAGGSLDLTGIDHGDWTRLDSVSLAGITDVSYRIGALGVGGRIEVRVGSTTGSLLSTVDVPATGMASPYTGVAAPILDPGGSHDVYFCFVGTAGSTNLFNLNWIDFIGPGAASGSLNALATIAVSPAAIGSAYREVPPSPVTFTVRNAGERTLNYTLTSDAPWVTVYPGTGSSTGEPDTFRVTFHTAGLPVGRHESVVRVVDPAATNPEVVLPVTLQRLARSDLDADGDVDGIDFILFRICATGAAVPAASDCLGRDLDGDGDVDAGDFGVFQSCFAGENRPPPRYCEADQS